MGIEALGPERAASFVADALSRCSHASWAAIADLFLEAHYPPRLASIAVCRDCGARNDVDAPYDREFDRGIEPRTNQAPFPDFDVFDEAARAAFERIKPAAKGVVLVVEGGVPACDEGGEPLLGSYVPPAGDPTSPMGAGIVTVYYRTFRAAHEEESEYPWESELKETIEHELAHHSGWLTGHDPTDEEERSEIVDERLRVVGRRAVARRVASDFAGDLREFIVRTWPIWLIVALVSVAISVCGQPN